MFLSVYLLLLLSLSLSRFRCLSLYCTLSLSLSLSHFLCLSLSLALSFLVFFVCLSLSLALSPLFLVPSLSSARSLSLCCSVALSPSLSRAHVCAVSVSLACSLAICLSHPHPPPSISFSRPSFFSLSLSLSLSRSLFFFLRVLLFLLYPLLTGAVRNVSFATVVRHMCMLILHCIVGITRICAVCISAFASCVALGAITCTSRIIVKSSWWHIPFGKSVMFKNIVTRPVRVVWYQLAC